jgi:hypothetical protein
MNSSSYYQLPSLFDRHCHGFYQPPTLEADHCSLRVPSIQFPTSLTNTRKMITHLKRPLRQQSESEFFSKQSDSLRSTSSSATCLSASVMSLSFIIHDDPDENQTLNKYEQKSKSEPKAKVQVFKQEAISQHTSLSKRGLQMTSLLNAVCGKEHCYRNIRGTNGHFCKYHKQSRFCRTEGCSKSAKTGGFCISHGGGKRCSHPECSKSAKQGGFCIAHGGGKRCREATCTKSALLGGFCSAHGGGRKCQFDTCAKTALLGGLCIAHGGGKRCQIEGCTKSAVGGIHCVSHGGGKRCQANGCNKGAVRNGVCIRHGAKKEEENRY